MVLLWLFGAVVLLGGFALWAIFWLRRFNDVVAAANAEGGTTFPTKPLLGNFRDGMVFDLKTRHALLVENRTWRTFDSAHFTRWSIEFDRNAYGAVRKVKLVIETRDFDEPRLIFPVRTLDDANHWVARISAFVNSR